MGRSLTTDDIVKREIEKTGKQQADYFIPELDMYCYIRLDGLGAMLTHDGEEYEQIDRKMHFYKSLCDSAPVDKFIGQAWIPVIKKREDGKTVTESRFMIEVVEEGSNNLRLGIQHKFLTSFKRSANHAIYFDRNRLWFWFLDLETMDPYMIICGVRTHLKPVDPPKRRTKKA